MKRLMLCEQELIVSLFFGKLLLKAARNRNRAKFGEFITKDFKTNAGIHSLELRVNETTIKCFFNPNRICYTCWITFDKFREEEYRRFCNKYFPMIDENTWNIRGNTTLELLVLDEEDYIVLT